MEGLEATAVSQESGQLELGGTPGATGSWKGCGCRGRGEGLGPQEVPQGPWGPRRRGCGLEWAARGGVQENWGLRPQDTRPTGSLQDRTGGGLTQRGSPRCALGVERPSRPGRVQEGGTWTALSSLSEGLARAASRAVVVVPVLEPRKRGYARSRLITPTPGGAGGHHGP